MMKWHDYIKIRGYDATPADDVDPGVFEMFQGVGDSASGDTDFASIVSQLSTSNEYFEMIASNLLSIGSTLMTTGYEQQRLADAFHFDNGAQFWLADDVTWIDQCWTTLQEWWTNIAEVVAHNAAAEESGNRDLLPVPVPPILPPAPIPPTVSIPLMIARLVVQMAVKFVIRKLAEMIYRKVTGQPVPGDPGKDLDELIEAIHSLAATEGILEIGKNAIWLKSKVAHH